ncbi:pantoate--beta-alanine ligase [Deltaproteobacteria bacterium]|nr:pantoate--beta-alanine ligase [Deltaproteobacteria bacterium]
MEIIDSVQGMQKRCEEIRMSGKRIALVPTMGFLHEGHLELMREGRRHADILVISIFVNPTQFGPAEDYDQYPRDMEGDLSKAKEVGVDIVFTPSAEDMYPETFQSRVIVERITKYLCGISRPGHFEGMATVVNKLFNITKPHLALFGQKDFQQVTVIRRMVSDLNMDIEICTVPTVREPDGLAMSSRNKYLNQEERKSALCLKESIDMARGLIKEGERLANTIKPAIERLILSHSFTNIEYISICDPMTMEDIDTIEGEFLLALAVKVGKTRLIDNGLIDISS